MMTPSMMNALLSGVLSAACLTAFADQSATQDTLDDEEASLSTLAAPLAAASEKVSVGSADDGRVEAVGRTSSDSMHSKGTTNSEMADEYKGNTLKNMSE
ncbi:hypothetical protein [Pseudomonas putida]